MFRGIATVIVSVVMYSRGQAAGAQVSQLSIFVYNDARVPEATLAWGGSGRADLPARRNRDPMERLQHNVVTIESELP